MKRKAGGEVSTNGKSNKRARSDEDVKRDFRKDLFDSSVLEHHRSEYANSTPYDIPRRAIDCYISTCIELYVLSTTQLHTWRYTIPHRANAPPCRPRRDPREPTLHPQGDRYLQDPPVGRSRESRWSRRVCSQIASFPPETSRCAVLGYLSRILERRDGRGQAQWDEDGYGDQRVHTGMPLAVP